MIDIFKAHEIGAIVTYLSNSSYEEGVTFLNGILEDGRLEVGYCVINDSTPWNIVNVSTKYNTHKILYITEPLEPEKVEYEEDCVYIYENGKYRKVLVTDPLIHAVYKNSVMYKTECHPLVRAEPEKVDCHICNYLDSVRGIDGIPPRWTVCPECGKKLEAE